MPKDNLLFKLDNLEYQYHYVNGDLSSFRPRLSGTSKLYNVKGKKSSKKVAKLLSEIDLKQLGEQLDALRLQIFNNKIHHLEKNLKSLLVKNLTQYRPKKNAKSDFTPLIEKIRDEFGFEKFSELVCKSKAIKLAIAKIVPSKKTDVPSWFANHQFWKVFSDKTEEFNPSRVWNEVLLPNKFDKLVSTFMNSDKYRSLFSNFDSGMNLFLGINREIDSKQKAGDTEKEAGAAGPDSQDKGKRVSPGDEDDKPEDTAELDEELLKQYDGMLGDSDEEEDGLDAAALKPDINYNEVTDEEPDQEDEEEDELSEAEDDLSDSESDLTQNKNKAKLPELIAGYYSGDDTDEESDPANDRVAKEQISTKEKKKNRRGQRARRKIWEKKYGREAKHIQREVEKEHQDRKRRQEEYEERVAKRAAKAKEFEARNTEAPRDNQAKVTSEKIKTEHPSWVAKRVAEEKLKNTKFQGKKITFD